MAGGLPASGVHSPTTGSSTARRGCHTTATSGGSTPGSDGAPPPASLDEALRIIADLRAQLRGRDDVIRHLVRQQGSAAVMTPHGGASVGDDGIGEVVVRDGAELVAAVEAGVNVISLDGATGAPFDLGPTPVVVDHKRLKLRPDGHSLHEPGTPAPRIQGHLLLRGGAHVTIRGIRIVASSSGRPVIEVSAKSTLLMSDCAVVGGRDGVYVSGGGEATLAGCTVQDNVRGVFEMHRCRVLLTNCRFIDNAFHAVLLATGSAPTRAGTARPAPGSVAAPLGCYAAGCTFVGGRGDVCTAYNPIQDEYSRVLVAATGQELQLAPGLRTTGLVDPTW